MGHLGPRDRFWYGEKNSKPGQTTIMRIRFSQTIFSWVADERRRKAGRGTVRPPWRRADGPADLKPSLWSVLWQSPGRDGRPQRVGRCARIWVGRTPCDRPAASSNATGAGVGDGGELGRRAFVLCHNTKRGVRRFAGSIRAPRAPQLARRGSLRAAVHGPWGFSQLTRFPQVRPGRPSRPLDVSPGDYRLEWGG